MEVPEQAVQFRPIDNNLQNVIGKLIFANPSASLGLKRSDMARIDSKDQFWDGSTTTEDHFGMLLAGIPSWSLAGIERQVVWVQELSKDCGLEARSGTSIL